MLKVLIKNGIIVDGTGKKPFKGDLLIEDSRIKEYWVISGLIPAFFNPLYAACTNSSSSSYNHAGKNLSPSITSPV